MHADAVLDVRPGADVALDRADPVRGSSCGTPPAGLGVGQVLADLPHDVGVVAVDRLLPLLVGIEELVPVGRLQRRPLLRVSAGAVGEPVDPALQQVARGIRLDVDRDVLVDRGLALGRREVAVGARCSRRGKSPRAPASASVKTGLGTLRSLTGASVSVSVAIRSLPLVAYSALVVNLSKYTRPSGTPEASNIAMAASTIGGGPQR